MDIMNAVRLASKTENKVFRRAGWKHALCITPFGVDQSLQNISFVKLNDVAPILKPEDLSATDWKVEDRTGKEINPIMESSVRETLIINTEMCRRAGL